MSPTQFRCFLSSRRCVVLTIMGTLTTTTTSRFARVRQIHVEHPLCQCLPIDRLLAIIGYHSLSFIPAWSAAAVHSGCRCSTAISRNPQRRAVLPLNSVVLARSGVLLWDTPQSHLLAHMPTPSSPFIIASYAKGLALDRDLLDDAGAQIAFVQWRMILGFTGLASSPIDAPPRPSAPDSFACTHAFRTPRTAVS
ncbi:hypothetical protein FA95DRAFT_579426 [Auriscalpium vulgare]|uniref:Uncharacterized protein n=1 Tax=Auriscalpium vulgare TaxID=40419 RepID=A0ACB8S3G0_9AGAM|nr:hypothetical protein FA95DRAFT_579426 [Auriscalpium vulgare]